MEFWSRCLDVSEFVLVCCRLHGKGGRILAVPPPDLAVERVHGSRFAGPERGAAAIVGCPAGRQAPGDLRGQRPRAAQVVDLVPRVPRQQPTARVSAAAGSSLRARPSPSWLVDRCGVPICEFDLAPLPRLALGRRPLVSGPVEIQPCKDESAERGHRGDHIGCGQRAAPELSDGACHANCVGRR